MSLRNGKIIRNGEITRSMHVKFTAFTSLRKIKHVHYQIILRKKIAPNADLFKVI